MSLSALDRRHISDAIHSAEAKTSCEIVCVLAQTSCDVTALSVVLAAAISLGVPWLLVFLTTMAVYQILSLQVATFGALLLLFCLPAVRVVLMPRAARRAIAHRVAMEQFAIRGLARANDRAAVLIFVSFAERYARIIADQAAAARVPQSEWQEAVDALVAHMRDGRIAEGFVTAISRCADVLAAHFPRTGTTKVNLPDRIHLI